MLKRWNHKNDFIKVEVEIHRELMVAMGKLAEYRRSKNLSTGPNGLAEMDHVLNDLIHVGLLNLIPPIREEVCPDLEPLG